MKRVLFSMVLLLVASFTFAQEKRTVVFVTNNIEEAIFLADRIILLSNSPAKIKKEYKITLPHPRDYVDEEFLKLREEITQNMDKVL